MSTHQSTSKNAKVKTTRTVVARTQVSHGVASLVIDPRRMAVVPVSIVSKGPSPATNRPTRGVKPAAKTSAGFHATLHGLSSPIRQAFPQEDEEQVAARLEAMRGVLQATLESLQKVQHSAGSWLPKDDLIRRVGETLAEKAGESTSVEEGWQALLEKGLRSKTALLSSKQFKSTAEASELMGIGEPAIRKRVREGKLFALKMPGDDEHRIPVWALDSDVAGKATGTLLGDATGLDAWHLYHFMTTPHGSLNGLRPFEVLMSTGNLTPSQQSARAELALHLGLPPKASMLIVVRKALQQEVQESAEA